MEITSPLAGITTPLGEVPDPVFAGGIVGPGIAITPPDGSAIRVLAPLSGRISKLHPHAFVITTDQDLSVLVHLGIDTVVLRGRGFDLHAQEGQQLEVGQPVVTWDLEVTKEAGLSPVVPIIVLAGATSQPEILHHPGTPVTTGTPLLRLG
ncbi:MAG: PTS glucose transporter subunit IIA [Actinomycetaceae bacterium]|nr:PTS glucose transporter subunit IIA [Actinomycetaceae bacterium]